MRTINKKIKIQMIFMLMLATGFSILQSKQDLTINEKRYNKKIEGQVLDKDDNGIKGAEVFIHEKNISTRTNKSGKFLFKIKGGGAFHIDIYKEGYLPYSTKVSRIAKRTDMIIPDIILTRSFIEQVVVTGTGTPKLYRETPVKTFIASKDMIEKKGAQNLADSLELVTGVRVEDNCQNCNFTQVRINGMEGKYCQILLNGMPVVSALAGVYALEQIPANLIESLEVVKGGGASLYGGNAIGGVVNVRLKEAETSGARLSINHGLVNNEPDTNVNFNFDYVAPNPDTKVNFFSTYQSRDPMDYNGDDFSDRGELTNLSIGSNFSHYFKKISGKLRLSFSVIKEERRGGNKFELPEHFADIAESIRTKRIDLSAGWEQVFSKVSILKINSAYSYTKRKSYYGAEQDPNAYGDSVNPVFFSEIRYYNFSLSGHDVIMGVSFKSDGIEDRAPAYDRMIDERYTDLGVYLQDEINLNDTWKILIGARGDKHSEISRMIFSPRTSISFSGIKDLTFRLTFSTGFRAPQVFDEDLHITQVGGEGMIIRNRAGLKEEKSYSLTFGIDFGRQVNNKLIQFSFSGFYNRLNDVFTLDEVESDKNYMVMERFNSDGAKVFGIELEAGFKIADSFEIFTGWTYQRNEYDTPEPDFDSKKMFRTPELYGSLRIEWNFKKFLSINTEMTYTGSMKVPHYAGFIPDDILEDSDPFTVINMSLNKKIVMSKKQSITLTASALNIFDDFQKDLDKGVYRDAGYIYGPRYPRTFRFGIKYNF